MPDYISKKKIFFIAVVLFAITMSAVFLFAEHDDAQDNKAHMQAFILYDFEKQTDLNEKDYRKILNNDDNEFIIVNPDRTFRYITEKVEKLHGYTLEEMQSDKINVLTFIHPKDLPAFANILMEFHQEMSSLNNVGPIRVKTKKGDYINYLMTLVPFTNEKSERLGTGVILKNIEKPLGETENKI